MFGVFGPTRKFSRGFANATYGAVEILYQPSVVNYYEGNSAAFSYGGVRGFGRWIFRMGAGWYEFLTWPMPTYKGSYRPFYRSNVPWIHGGYTEFPPELGFETQYRYSRATYAYPH